MVSAMPTIAFMLMSALAANAVNLRRQPVTTTVPADPLETMSDFEFRGVIGWLSRVSNFPKIY